MRSILELVILFNIFLNISCITGDFKENAQLFAYNLGKKYGTTVNWVDLDAKHPDMKQYQDKHVKYTYLSTKLEDEGKLPSTGPAEYFEQWFDNNCTNEQNTVFTREQQTENTFELSFTEKFGMSTKIEESISIPATGSEKFSLEVSLDLSSTQSVTKREVKKWKINQNIRIPPNKSVVFKFMVQEDIYQDFWFNSEVMLEGFIAFWFKEKIDLNNDPKSPKDNHWLWFIPVEDVIKTMGQNNYYFKDGKAIYKARGKINGKIGIKSYVSLEEHDLRPKEKLRFLQ